MQVNLSTDELRTITIALDRLIEKAYDERLRLNQWEVIKGEAEDRALLDRLQTLLGA